MTFMHWKIPGSAGDTVHIHLDTPAYVRMLDTLNFEYYKRGQKYSGEGGWSDGLEADFVLPYKGTFYVTVDLGGQAGVVKATCDIGRR